MTETIIPEFERTHEVTVTYQGVTSSEALSRVLGQRGRPEASLVIANDRDVTRGFTEGVWTPLDEAAIPTLARWTRRLAATAGSRSVSASAR
jgi:hypothetical protein